MRLRLGIPDMLLRSALPVRLCVLLIASMCNACSVSADESADWRIAIDAVRNDEAIVIMRHALASGTGDPVNFTLDDCTTQRNLSDEGRAQADGIGRFLARQLDVETEVFSSAWCRCLDTARLLSLGPVSRLDSLNSFFRQHDRSAAQTTELRHWIGRRLQREASSVAVLVTHQVNITALTGVFPASGELLIVDVQGQVLARTTRYQ